MASSSQRREGATGLSDDHVRSLKWEEATHAELFRKTKPAMNTEQL